MGCTPSPRESKKFCQDKVVTLKPYFRAKDESEEGVIKFNDAIKEYSPVFYELTKTESGVVHYGFSKSKDNTELHCREGYVDAAALLAHLKNVKAPLDSMLEVANVRLEVHGPVEEIEKLRKPLGAFGAEFFVQCGFPGIRSKETAKDNDNCCDTMVTLEPYFEVLEDGEDGKSNHEGCMSYTENFVKLTSKEAGVLTYCFTSGVKGDKKVIHCREGYADAKSVLAHLANVDEVLKVMLKSAKITKLDVHGPAEELMKLVEPLKDLNPNFYELDSKGPFCRNYSSVRLPAGEDSAVLPAEKVKQAVEGDVAANDDNKSAPEDLVASNE